MSGSIIIRLRHHRTGAQKQAVGVALPTRLTSPILCLVLSSLVANDVREGELMRCGDSINGNPPGKLMLHRCGKEIKGEVS